jgi:iron complex transport system permease protein
LAAALMTAAAVSVSGLIGFVGLIIPHFVRLILGANHRMLVPFSALGGALLVLGADILARTVLSPQEIPIGIVMSLLGAPFFLYLLRRRRSGEK